MPAWDELFKQERIQKAFERPDGRVIEFVRQTKGRGRALDLGCGTGRHTICLAQRGYKVTAADLSRKALRLTAKRLEEESLSAHLVCCDMASLPFRPRSFEVVLSIHTLYHQRLDGIKMSMAQIHDILSDGGQALLTFNSTKSHAYGEGTQIEPHTFVPRSDDEAGIPHHYLDRPRLLDLVAAFEIVNIELVEDDPEHDSEARDGRHGGHHAQWWVALLKKT
jgi:SAM-dependent methyltransferase